MEKERYKKGDWIVRSTGFGPKSKQVVMQAGRDRNLRDREDSFLRFATAEEIEIRKSEIAQEEGKRQLRVAYEATPAFQDAASILCLSTDDLVKRVPADLLAQVAGCLREPK